MEYFVFRNKKHIENIKEKKEETGMSKRKKNVLEKELERNENIVDLFQNMDDSIRLVYKNADEKKIKYLMKTKKMH